MRAKTVRPSSNIPVKRTSEGLVKVTSESTESETTKSSALTAPVFPVKFVLKNQEHVELDKENINPLVNWDDLDAEDAGDPLMVSDYVVEIFEYMNELEVNRSGVFRNNFSFSFLETNYSY